MYRLHIMIGAALLLMILPSASSFANLQPQDWREWYGTNDPSVDPNNWDEAQANVREIIWHAQNDAIKQPRYNRLKLWWAQSNSQFTIILQCQPTSDGSGQSWMVLSHCFVPKGGDPAPGATIRDPIPGRSYWAFVRDNVLPKLRDTNRMPYWPLVTGS